MEVNKSIFKAKQALAARLQSSSSTIYAVVKSVEQDKRTCNVTIDDAEFTDVLLYSVENVDLKGFVMIPKVDSTVLVSRIGGSNELYVSMFSEVDKVLLTIGDKVSMQITEETVEVDAEKIVFNGGHNKGLVKIEELTDKINALVDAFNSHTHKLMSGTVVVSGSPTSQTNPAPIEVPAITAKTQKLNKTDYENEKITH